MSTISNLEPQGLWGYFDDLCKVPRPSKKEEKVIDFLMNWAKENNIEAIKDEIAFFQAVKARINKFVGSGVKSDYEVETAIKQIVDDALASDGVVDIFDAAGIKAPSVGILSDEFLLEVKNMHRG